VHDGYGYAGRSLIVPDELLGARALIFVPFRSISSCHPSTSAFQEASSIRAPSPASAQLYTAQHGHAARVPRVPTKMMGDVYVIIESAVVVTMDGSTADIGRGICTGRQHIQRLLRMTCASMSHLSHLDNFHVISTYSEAHGLVCRHYV